MGRSSSIAGTSTSERRHLLSTGFAEPSAGLPRVTVVKGLTVDPRLLLQAVRDAYEQGRDEATIRAAVDAARDAGVEWGRIADALETRRGNAYKRYRRLPRRPDDAPER
jgi:hypothetical protein